MFLSVGSYDSANKQEVQHFQGLWKLLYLGQARMGQEDTNMFLDKVLWEGKEGKA